MSNTDHIRAQVQELTALNDLFDGRRGDLSQEESAQETLLGLQKVIRFQMDLTGEITPMVWMVTTADELTLEPLEKPQLRGFELAQFGANKELASFVMRRLAKDMQAVGIFIISEAWEACDQKLPPEEFARLVSEHKRTHGDLSTFPGVRDIAIIQYEHTALGSGCVRAPLSIEGNKRILGEFNDDKKLTLQGGLFANILPRDPN